MITTIEAKNSLFERKEKRGENGREKKKFLFVVVIAPMHVRSLLLLLTILNFVVLFVGIQVIQSLVDFFAHVVQKITSMLKLTVFFTHIAVGLMANTTSVPGMKALDEVCRALASAAGENSKRILSLIYSGSAGLLSSECIRLWLALGATVPRSTLCLTAGRVALGLHYGSTGHSARIESTRGMPLTVWWGGSMLLSLLLMSGSIATQDPATKVAVIDTRSSKTCESGHASFVMRALFLPRGGVQVCFCVVHEPCYDPS